MFRINKIITIIVAALTSCAIGMDHTYVSKPYATTPAVTTAPAMNTSAACLAKSVTKSIVATKNIPSCTSYSTTSAPYLAFQSTPQALEAHKKYEIAQFKTSLEGKPMEMQLSILATLKSSLDLNTQELFSLQRNLEALTASKTQNLADIAHVQDLITTTKNTIELHQAQFHEGLRVFEKSSRLKFEMCETMQSRVAHAIELLVLHDKIKEGRGNPDLMKACADTLSSSLSAIQHELASKCNHFPSWLADSWLSKQIGTACNETMWGELQDFRNRFKAFFHDITPRPNAPSLKDHVHWLETLSKDFIQIENFDRHLDDMSRQGIDFIKNVDKQEFLTLREDLAAYKRAITAITETIEKSSTFAVASCHMKISTTPQCFSNFINCTFWYGNQPQALWHAYVTEVRDFALKHYSSTIQPKELHQSVTPNQRWATLFNEHCNNLVALHEQMMRKMVVVCQLEQQLDAMAKVGVDTTQAREFHDVRNEVKDFGNYLAHMITQCHDDIKFQNSHAVLKDFHDIVQDIESEQRATYFDKRSKQDFLSKAATFFASALSQHYLNIDITTNFHDAPAANVGPLKFTLPSKSKDIGSEISNKFASLNKQSGTPVQNAAQKVVTPTVQAATITTGNIEVVPAAAQVATAPSMAEQGQQKRTYELMRHAAQLTAVASCKRDQESQALAKAYEPLGSVLALSTGEPTLAQCSMLLDGIETITATHNASLEFAKTGNAGRAQTWAEIRDALSTVYSTLLLYSNEGSNGRIITGAAMGGIEGCIDVAQGIHQLVQDPEKALNDFGLAAVKLTNFFGDLCILDQEAVAATKKALINFYNLPIEEKARCIIRLVVSFKVAPELLNKVIGAGRKAGTTVLSKTETMEAARCMARNIATNLSEFGADITKAIQDDKAIAMTVDGIPVTTHVATDTKIFALAETTKDVQGMEKTATSVEKAATLPKSEGLQTSVKAGEVIATEVTAEKIAEIAHDLKCAPEKESILSKLKGYLDKGVRKDNRIETMLDIDTKIQFRKDFNVHALSAKRGYPPGVKINHYNIEIQIREHPGTNLNDWTQLKGGLFHIVVDKLGNVTDFY